MNCCRWLGRKLRGLSLDSLLSYSTVKVVQIRDKRVGALHYLFLFLVLGYIVGWTVLYQKRYLLEEAPIGSIRLSLQSPQTAEPPRPVPPASEIPYCNNNGTRPFGPYGFPNQECWFIDENMALWPVAEEKSMFISTRMSSLSQNLKDNCSLSENTCIYVPISNYSFFAGNIENFTVQIDHTMFAPRLGIQANARSMPGSIVNQDGDTMKLKPFETIAGHDQADVLFLSTILEAAGVHSLDEASDATKGVSMRSDGIILLVFITYSNTYSFNQNHIKYQYSVTKVEDTKFKALQTIDTKVISHGRVIWNRHGVRMIFLQTGTLGKFDFQTLLLSLVSGLGLMALATLIVDTLVLKILPTKTLYSRYKFLETPEWHSMGKHGEKKDYEAINVNEREPTHASDLEDKHYHS